MTSGNNVYREFGSYRQQLDDERRRVASKLLGLQTANENALEEEAELWKSFASFHIAEPVELPAAVLKSLKDRSEKVEKSKAAAPEHEHLIAVAQKQAGLYQGKIDVLTADIDKEEAEIRERFLVDARVKSIMERLSFLETSEDDLDGKHKRAIAERDQKRGAYEADTHFVYLRKRKFGTDQYKAFPLFAALDRRLAASMNFVEANGNYERLLAIPDWIEKRVENLQPEIATLTEGLKALEREYFHVTDDLHKAMDDLVEKRDAALAEADRQADALHRVNQFIADAALAQDSDLKKAVGQLADILKRNGLDDLGDLARKTATSEDDKIVRSLETLREGVRVREGEAAALSETINELERKIASIRRVENEIDSNNWNASGHSFSGISVELLVRGLIQGALNEALIIRQLDGAHRRPPPPPRPSTSSGGFSSSRSSGSSGGFRSGGGFGGGGGGFKTGGGF